MLRPVVVESDNTARFVGHVGPASVVECLPLLVQVGVRGSFRQICGQVSDAVHVTDLASDPKTKIVFETSGKRNMVWLAVNFAAAWHIDLKSWCGVWGHQFRLSSMGSSDSKEFQATKSARCWPASTHFREAKDLLLSLTNFSGAVR